MAPNSPDSPWQTYRYWIKTPQDRLLLAQRSTTSHAGPRCPSRDGRGLLYRGL